jgi:hypothetical protein
MVYFMSQYRIGEHDEIHWYYFNGIAAGHCARANASTRPAECERN